MNISFISYEIKITTAKDHGKKVRLPLVRHLLRNGLLSNSWKTNRNTAKTSRYPGQISADIPVCLFRVTCNKVSSMFKHIQKLSCRCYEFDTTHLTVSLVPAWWTALCSLVSGIFNELHQNFLDQSHIALRFFFCDEFVFNYYLHLACSTYTAIRWRSVQ